MSSDLSKYMGNRICRWLAGNNMPAAPATVYLALFDGDPKASGTEISAVISSGRQAITWDAISADDVDNLLTLNADIDFGDSISATDKNLSHAALFDASTSGHALASKAITGGARTISLGTQVKFLTGDLTFTVGS